MKFAPIAAIIVIVFICFKIKGCHDAVSTKTAQTQTVATSSTASLSTPAEKPTVAQTEDAVKEDKGESSPHPQVPTPAQATTEIGSQFKALAVAAKKALTAPKQYKGWEASEVQVAESGRKFVRYTWAPKGNPEEVEMIPCAPGVSPFFTGSIIYDGIIVKDKKEEKMQIKTSWGKFFKQDDFGIWTMIEKSEFGKLAGQFIKVRPLPADSDGLEGYVDMFFR